MQIIENKFTNSLHKQTNSLYLNTIRNKQNDDTMTAQQINTRDEIRKLNLQINSQLTRNGVLDRKGRLVRPLSSEPESEWKTWITALIAHRDALQEQEDQKEQLSDDLNPAFLFSTTYTHLLVKIATGEVDAQRLARVELAARGLSLQGAWIGFAAAKAEHKI